MVKDNIQSQKDAYEEIIEWLETHEGRMPRSQIRKNGEILKRGNLTKEEIDEINLYVRWRNSREYILLRVYAGTSVNEILEPEAIRKRIETLRSYGLGKKESILIDEEIIQWLEEHEGKMPRGSIRKDRKNLKKEDLTEEEFDERNLYARWRTSKLRKMLDEYAGIPIEKIPEIEEIKEKIKILRSYGLGKEKKSTYEELIEWLDNHEGKMPRSSISKDAKILKKEELSEEEIYERNLYARWTRTDEYKMLNQYAGVPIEEIQESEEMKAKIEALRSYGLGMKSSREKTAYEELIEWLDNHDGKMPRGAISKEAKILKKEELSEEEIYERNLYTRWQYSKERKMLNKFAGIPIEEVPEEWREKIEKLRSLGQLGKSKDGKIKDKMQGAVANRVDSNEEVRKEVEDLVKERQQE